MHHPDLTKNIISVASLLEDPAVQRVVFDRNGSKVHMMDGLIALTGKQVGGLYPQDQTRSAIESKQSSHAVAYVSSLSERRSLHIKFGHTNDQNLNKMIEMKSLRGLPATLPKASDGVCVSCVKSKLTTKSFRSSVPKHLLATKVLQRVHADLHGPVTPQSLGGAMYALIIVDEFSERVWSYPLRRKSDAAAAIMSWAGKVNAECGTYPRD